MQERTVGSAELVLTASVARRYYFDGASKSDIAADLQLSRFKVARLLEHARASGLVRIEFDYRGELDLDLSVRLQAAYGLRYCTVIDSPTNDEVLLRANVGHAAAGLLAEILNADDVVGLAWARSLVAMQTSQTQLAACPVVQLTGALQRSHTEDSCVDLVREVARASGGPSYCFYAPLLVPDAATAQALRSQPEIARTMARFADVTAAVVGVGAWHKGQSTVADAVTDDEWRQMHDLGVRAELAGIQLDADGAPITTSLTERLIGITAQELRAVPDVLAVVYGTANAGAVQAAVRGGFVSSLITHTAMADELLNRA